MTIILVSVKKNMEIEIGHGKQPKVLEKVKESHKVRRV